jgi:hypothetical protein
VHPAFRELPPPLIVIGMHRSGTSLVSEILEALGVYMGCGVDGHREAPEFVRLNEELLYRAGAAWHHVDPFLEHLNHSGFRTSAALRLAAATHGQLRTSYLAGAPTEVHAWGWKDPRNSLTLPLWLRLFPYARVLHVARDLEGAARSVARRAAVEHPEGAPEPPRRWSETAGRMLAYPPAAARFVARRLGHAAPSPSEAECSHLERARALGQQYIDACYRNRDLGGSRVELRYEQLLERPLETVERLAAFTLGDVSAERTEAAAALVRRPAAAA